MSWDYGLFCLMNFDGGAFLDSVMLFVSGRLSWVWLYLLILWLTYRRYGWRGVLLALVTIGCAVGISDMVAGIFKHTGLLKNLWTSFHVRLRPMHTPELEGVIHIVKQGGRYGTVSAHAATATAIGFIATRIIDKRWFSAVMWTQVVLVCYSRIYLAYHFPQDIIIGVALGVGSGYLMWRLFRWALQKLNKEDEKDRYKRL